MTARPTLKTQRLLLRPFEPTDAATVQRLAGDRAIADTTLNIPHPYEDGVAGQWISTHQPKWEAGELATFAIVSLDTNELAGAIGLAIKRQFDSAELGYWIGKPYWGRGFCTEAARAVLRFAFTALALNRVHAAHIARNPASGRVMQKLGMMHEGIRIQHVKRWGRYDDLVLYGLLKEDWAKNRESADAPGSSPRA